MSTSTSPRRAGSTRRTAVIIGLIALAITFALVIYQLVTTAGEEPTPVATDPAASQDVAGSGETPSGDGDGEPATAVSLPAPVGNYTPSPELAGLARLDPDDPTALGPVDAPVTMVIWSDYMCPYCARFSLETLPELEKYAEEGILRVEWRDFAVYGQDAVNAAIGAQAAGKQGKFWEMHDWIFENQQPQGSGNVTEEFLAAGAEEVGVDVEQWTADFADPNEELYNALSTDGQEVLSFAAPSTPTFVIGGVLIVGAQPTEAFVDVVSWSYHQEQ